MLCGILYESIVTFMFRILKSFHKNECMQGATAVSVFYLLRTQLLIPSTKEA